MCRIYFISYISHYFKITSFNDFSYNVKTTIVSWRCIIKIIHNDFLIKFTRYLSFINVQHLSIIILFKTIITFYSILSYISNIRHHNNCFMKIKFILKHQLFHEKCITKFTLAQQLFQNSTIIYLACWVPLRMVGNEKLVGDCGRWGEEKPTPTRWSISSRCFECWWLHASRWCPLVAACRWIHEAGRK